MKTYKQWLLLGFIIILTINFFLLVGCDKASCCQQTTFTVNKEWVQEEADWLMQALTNDGAIADTPQGNTLTPYEAHYAAWGLLEAGQVTGNSAYTNAVWNWLQWYYNHMDINGFVEDYRLSGGVWVPTGDMDSTESYAAMYLLVYNEALKITNNNTLATTLRPSIIKALGAIEATMDSDGLTWAKPGWRVKYLMDQVEIYAGLGAGASLAEYFGDNDLQEQFETDRNLISQGIENLWDGYNQSYDWAKVDQENNQLCNWNQLYPDALEEVWPVAFGVISGLRAQLLLTHFESQHSNWDLSTTRDIINGSLANTGYWPVVGWAYLKLGNPNRAISAINNIRAAALASNRAWPYCSMTAGELIILETGGF